jgi:fibronectin-binding autotransporter adhesin
MLRAATGVEVKRIQREKTMTTKNEERRTKNRMGIGWLAAVLGVMLLACGGARGATWSSDADGSWSEAAKWDGGVPNAVGATASLSNSISADRVVTLDQNATVGALTMKDMDATPNSWTIAQGGAYTLTLDATGVGPATLTVGHGNANAINVPVTLTDPLTLSVATGTKLTFGGNLSGSGKITTKSPGTVRLAGDNSGFSGGIHVDVSAATTFELMNASALGTGSVTFNASGGAPVFTNASGGSLTISTPIGVQSHSVYPHFAGSDMTFTDFSLSSGKTVSHLFYVDGTTTLTLPNGIAVNSGSRKAGTGSMTITGASAGGLMGWEGGGTLKIGHDQALGNGTTFRAWNGTYIAEGGNRVVNNVTTFGAAGVAALTFDLSNGNNLTFSAASTSIANDFQMIVTGPGVLTISGNATGAFKPQKYGTGELDLTGDNSGVSNYGNQVPSSSLNGFHLSAGTLGLGNDKALGPNPLLVDAAGTTLKAVGGARTIANYIYLQNSLTINTTDSLTLTGMINDYYAPWGKNGGLVLSAGTVTLTASNAYSQGTTVNGGTLVAGHANALGTAGTITVNSNGTFAVAQSVTFSRAVTFNAGSGLGGSGTFVKGGAWTVPGSFTILPGLSTNAASTLTVDTAGGALTFGNNTLEIDFDAGGVDQLAINGALDLGGASDTLVLRGVLPSGISEFTIVSAASVSGTFGSIDLSGLSRPVKVRYPGDGRVLVMSPPAGTAITFR